MKSLTSKQPSAEKNKKVLLIFAAFIVYFLLILVLYPGLIFDFSTKIPSANHADVKNILSIIIYSTHTELSNIYHLPIFYPESFVLARTHPLFGVSVFFKIFQVLGLGLEQSTNLYIILALLLGAFGCFLFAREMSQNAIFSFLFSTLYIVHHKNLLLFNWLNFLSYFYLPYIFYFLLRFFKTKKRAYILGAALLTLFQTLSSIYIGVQIWFFLIPAFLIFALLLKIISIKHFGQALIFLLMSAVILLFIFSPFTNITQTQIKKRTVHNLVNAGDLFHYSKLTSFFFASPLGKNLYFFPGFSVILFVLFFTISFLKNKRLRILFLTALIIFTAVMSCLVYIDLLVLEIFFLVFLCLIAVTAVLSWNNMNQWVKLLILTFSFYFLVMLKIEYIPVLNSLSLFDFLSRWLPISGLTAIKRAFIVILPFLIAAAAMGGTQYLRSFENLSKKKKLLWVFIILSLMVIENVRLQKHEKMMTELIRDDAEIYQKIPFRKNKIILEIPFYFDRSMPKNSSSLLNWQCHQNNLLNGNTSIVPKDYVSDLKSIIGSRQHDFPTENKLKLLIQKYSVTHILFHWDLIRERLGESLAVENIKTLVDHITEYGKIIHNNEEHTVLRTQEFIPVSKIIRTYSLYHLRKKKLKILLDDEYAGGVEIKLNDRLIQERQLNSRSFSLAFKNYPLNVSGNRIEVSFEQDVLLRDIELID
jgi:hypothetical protein